MSKGLSGLFFGTIGAKRGGGYDIIASRVIGLDLHEHPVKKTSNLSMREINKRIQNRTATKGDYQQMERNRRLAKRRETGVNSFWEQERERLITGQSGTRVWSRQQI